MGRIKNFLENRYPVYLLGRIKEGLKLTFKAIRGGGNKEERSLSFSELGELWGGKGEEDLYRIQKEALMGFWMFLIFGAVFSFLLAIAGKFFLSGAVALPALMGAFISLWRYEVLKKRSYVSFRGFLKGLGSRSLGLFRKGD
jgi:hypothetical protein